MYQKPLWTKVPLPLSMTLRGLLPRWLGGEMIYEAVIRTNHFRDVDLLVDYLISQQIVAAMRGESAHVQAISKHTRLILDRVKADRCSAQSNHH